MKQCVCCHEKKDESSFRKGNKKCKKCVSKRNYLWNKKHPECLKTSNQKYSKTHPRYKTNYGIGRRTIEAFGLKLALYVYDRAGRKCEQCGEVNDLTIHHKDGKGRHNKEKGLEVNNHSDNLQILCRRCHGSLHAKQYWNTKKNVRWTDVPKK